MSEDGAAPRRWRRLRRVLAGIGVTLAALAALAALLYSFGTMQPPSAEARAGYDRAAAAGLVAPRTARLGIPIPGCVCHSDDPVVQVQHSGRYIRECSGCHAR